MPVSPVVVAVLVVDGVVVAVVACMAGTRVVVVELPLAATVAEVFDGATLKLAPLGDDPVAVSAATAAVAPPLERRRSIMYISISWSSLLSISSTW